MSRSQNASASAPILPCQHPPAVLLCECVRVCYEHERRHRTSFYFRFDSLRSAPYCLRVGRNPGKKNHTRQSPPPAPTRHLTLLYFDLALPHPDPQTESTSLAYLVPSTASAQYCATTTPAFAITLLTCPP